MNVVKLFLLSLLTVFLVGCGGGGGSPGTTQNSGGTTPTTTTTTVTVDDFYFQLDKVSVTNSGADFATLSVTAVDKNRNIVPSALVVVSVDSRGVFTPSGGNSTNASGVYTGVVRIGDDKSNRIINATITVNGKSKVASISVIGGQISITPIPATPVPGGTVTVNIAIADSAGTPISGAVLTLDGTLLNASQSISTELSGGKAVVVQVPATGGTYTFTVAGLGLNATKVIQVVSPGSSTIPSAVGVVSSAVLQPQFTSIAPNMVGSTTNRTKLSAKFINASNVGLENMRVRFQLVPPLLGGGESISTGDGIVYSDVNGEAISYYISGTRSSPTNGVKLRICYKPTDFVSSDFDASGNCVLSAQVQEVDANLTVAATALAISISSDNTLAKGLGGIAYVKKFLIQVNDSAGVAVPGAIVSASVDITHYGKGIFEGLYPYATLSSTYPYVPMPSSLPKILDSRAVTTTTISVGSSTTVTAVTSSINPIGSTPVNQIVPGVEMDGIYRNVWCANEDVNRNGFLDINEDVNGDGVITPAKSEIVISYVNGTTTDANGQLLLQVTYGQNVATWLAYTVRATTSVAGSAGDASKNFVTEPLDGDVKNGSFLTPPFGSGSCGSQN